MATAPASEVLGGVCDAAASSDITVLLAPGTGASVPHDAQLIGLVEIDGEPDVRLARPPLPLVRVGHPRGGLSRCAVVADHAGAASAVVEELLSHGHRRIGYLHGRTPGQTSSERLVGVESALLAADVLDVDLIATEIPNAAGGRLAGLGLLQLPSPPTALICFNERMAMGAYQAAAELGLSVPGAVSLVAYEDLVDVVDDLRPPLTSIASPYRQIGREAVRQLLAGSWVGSAPEIRVACTLRRRHSVAPLSGG